MTKSLLCLECKESCLSEVNAFSQEICGRLKCCLYVRVMPWAVSGKTPVTCSTFTCWWLEQLSHQPVRDQQSQSTEIMQHAVDACVNWLTSFCSSSSKWVPPPSSQHLTLTTTTTPQCNCSCCFLEHGRLIICSSPYYFQRQTIHCSFLTFLLVSMQMRHNNADKIFIVLYPSPCTVTLFMYQLCSHIT